MISRADWVPVSIRGPRLHIMSIALGGCLRAEPVQYGITEDTGGHITYILGEMEALARRDDVELAEIVTRRFVDERLGAIHAQSEEWISDTCVIRRIDSGDPRYLAKEALAQDRAAFIDALFADLRARSRLPDIVHAHFADAADIAAQIEREFGIPFIYTAHSLGLDKRAAVTAPGPELAAELDGRIAEEDRAIGAASAIIGSSLMGSISGSAVANVVSTGVFTIPLMKKTGVSAHRAAGIEAIASTGGQLMPPIMGVAAFIMAELLGIPYAQVALAGLIPAVAFYLALIMVVDLSARREGVRALTAEEVAETPAILPRLHLIIPPLVLIGLLVGGYSASYSAVLASLSCFIVPFLRRNTRIGTKEVIDALRDTPKQVADVAVPIAAIGIVIAVAVQSNLALKFAGSLLSLSEGSIYLSLMLAMVGCIVMGMGLPTVAAYIIGAVLFVPAIQKLGIAPLPAHFFIFYYCVLSMVTPPVALASFAAAAVGQASTVRTSLSAFGLSLVAFFVPFAFVFDPGVLAQGSAAQIVFSALSLLISTALWAVAFGGWAGRPLGWGTRIPVALAGLVAVIAPSGSTPWIVALVIGWALVVGIAMLARRTPSALPNPAE